MCGHVKLAMHGREFGYGLNLNFPRFCFDVCIVWSVGWGGEVAFRGGGLLNHV